jgi:hypothetical protein
MGLWVIPVDTCKIFVQDPIMQKVYHRSGLKMKRRILFGQGFDKEISAQDLELVGAFSLLSPATLA